MILGYARVSTDEQTTHLQRDALKAAGCETVFEDKGISGALAGRERPGLARLMKRVVKGDVLTVWKLDRLGRSLGDLIAIVRELEQRGAHLRSLTEGFDTTKASGRLVFQLMGALAEFERSLLVERTQAGLAAAKARGVHVGRRPVLTPEQRRDARRRIESGDPVRTVARILGVDKSTLYRNLTADEQREAQRRSVAKTKPKTAKTRRRAA